MKERPILFTAPMVRALLDGRKTQTRRIIKPQPAYPFRSASGAWVDMGRRDDADHKLSEIRCPYGWPPLGDQPGDQLWVRETWCPPHNNAYLNNHKHLCWYRADNESRPYQKPEHFSWRPSIHMPRWASRITLEITDVRVERLQDISKQDVLAEGIRPFYSGSESPCSYGINEEGCGFGEPGSWNFPETPALAYRKLWEFINGPKSWHANPWVWVIEIKRVKS